MDIDRIDGLLNPDAEINLFRIVQESVNNILAHANATEATVRIKKDRTGIELTIEDNGCGFDSVSARRHRPEETGLWPDWNDRTGSAHRGGLPHPVLAGERHDCLDCDRHHGTMTTKDGIRVAIADDHPVVRQGLRVVWRSTPICR